MEKKNNALQSDSEEPGKLILFSVQNDDLNRNTKN